MEKIKLLCMGRIKDKGLCALSQDYARRISAYISLAVTEIRESRTKQEIPDDPIVVEQFNRHLTPRDHLVLLDPTGEKMSSIDFSRWLSTHFSHNQSPLIFAIGGAFGLPSSLKGKARSRLSFSDMTFPHDLFRVMFLEQIYRAMTLIHNHPYHK